MSGNATSSGSDKPAKFAPLRADVLLSNTLFEELDSGITPDFLKQHTGKDNLEEVEFLEMQVDAVSGSQRVECLGEHMPNLTEMRLSQSAVCTIRDLGTNYQHLRVLFLCRSSLQDLGGITAMPVLEELFVSFNDVRDLSPLFTHDTLQVLDVEGNLIEDFEEIASLQGVSSLRELTVSANPVCKSDIFSRKAVLEALPQLQVLDDCLRAEEPADGMKLLDVDDCALDEDEAFLAECRRLQGIEDTTSGSDKEAEAGDELRPLTSICQLMKEQEGAVLEDTESSEAVAQLRSSWAALRAETDERCKTAASGGSPTKGKTCDPNEPSEQDLIVENLKRARKPPPSNIWSMQAMAAQRERPCTHAGTFFSPDKRNKTAWSSSASSTTYRPPSSAGGSFISSSTVPSSSTAFSAAEEADETSDLTTGGDGSSLAGNALSAIRRRRKVVKDKGVDENSIRDLMRRFETYKQESCLSQAELEQRRRKSETKRPGTSDVRVSAPRLLTANGRPAAFPTSLPGAPGESWVPKGARSLPGAPGEGFIKPNKRPSSRQASRQKDFAETAFTAPTFETAYGEALIIE